MNSRTKENEIRKALEDYSKWLEERGYLDSDWWCEEPRAIDEYLKYKKTKGVVR